MEQETENKTNRNVNQGSNVRKLRQILGIKQEDMAEQLGFSQQFLSQLEHRRVIGDQDLAKIARMLNISPQIIQELEENPLSVVIENNTFENGSYQQNNGIIENDQTNETENNQQIHPLDKVMELSKETGALYERMLTLEREKSALLEQLPKEKQG